MITTDFSYCYGVGFHCCEHCERYINKYPDLKNKNVWILEPTIQMVNCENYVEIAIDK